MTGADQRLKRCVDIVASILGLILSSVPMLIIGLIIKMQSPGPVLYRQKRVGRQGNVFTCSKFRTMFTGAEQQGSITAVTDGRITRVGKILRKYKLDELPQLWNVLNGKMSFVGPRPDVPGYADRLAGESRKILELRPGITGHATLYFRYEEEILAKVSDPQRFNDSVIWPKKVELNLTYLNEWSFWKDFGYILITVLPSLNRYLRLIQDSPRRPEDIPVDSECFKRK